MSWSVSAFVPASRALIFDTATAPMTTSARIIAPNAMPRRYASRRLLKRDMLPPGKQKLTRGGGATGARRHSGHRPQACHIERFTPLRGHVLPGPRPRAFERTPGKANGPAGRSPDEAAVKANVTGGAPTRGPCRPLR